MTDYFSHALDSPARTREGTHTNAQTVKWDYIWCRDREPHRTLKRDAVRAVQALPLWPPQELPHRGVNKCNCVQEALGPCFGWAETRRGYGGVKLVGVLVVISRKRNSDFVLQTMGVALASREQGVDCLQL